MEKVSTGGCGIVGGGGGGRYDCNLPLLCCSVRASKHHNRGIVSYISHMSSFIRLLDIRGIPKDCGIFGNKNGFDKDV